MVAGGGGQGVEVDERGAGGRRMGAGGGEVRGRTKRESEID